MKLLNPNSNLNTLCGSNDRRFQIWLASRTTHSPFVESSVDKCDIHSFDSKFLKRVVDEKLILITPIIHLARNNRNANFIDAHRKHFKIHTRGRDDTKSMLYDPEFINMKQLKVNIKKIPNN